MAKQQLAIRDQINSDSFREQLARVQTKHCTADRIVRVAMTALRIPAIARCTPESVMSCLMKCSQWGIEPDGDHAHLVPYGKDCELIIDYKGLCQLAYRTGQVSTIHADIGREGDIFGYSAGKLHGHVPWFLRQDDLKPESKGEVIAAYANVVMKNGAEKCEVMDVDDINQIKKKSKAGSKGPWNTDWNEMAKKTVFRRCSKWIPRSAEFVDAVQGDYDNRSDINTQPQTGGMKGLKQRFAELQAPAEEPPTEVIDAETGEILPAQPVTDNPAAMNEPPDDWTPATSQSDLLDKGSEVPL